jgi:3-methyladenine DNA glycosylase AlkD
MSHAVAEVDDRLAQAGRDVPPETAAVRGAYHGGNASHLGLTIPVQRDLFRAGYSFSGLSPQDQLPIWDYVWHRTAFHEGRNQALFFAEKIVHGQIDEKIVWKTTRRWAEDIQSWDISDGLSSIYVRLLAKIPDTVYPALVKWNRSRNSWLRRQSIVSLYYFGGKGRPELAAQQVLPLIKALLHDPDPYVQKAVGWALREASVVHPKATKSFLLQYATSLSGIALPAAIAKLPDASRASIKRLRAEKRRRKTDRQ